MTNNRAMRPQRLPLEGRMLDRLACRSGSLSCQGGFPIAFQYQRVACTYQLDLRRSAGMRVKSPITRAPSLETARQSGCSDRKDAPQREPPSKPAWRTGLRTAKKERMVAHAARSRAQAESSRPVDDDLW